MEKLEKLEKEIQKINERNRRVEIDKAWETSWTRRLLLIIFTYTSISLYMYAMSLPNPWVNAIVPSIGFLLSTLTLPVFRKLWENYRRS